jgi:hypothetical protein
VFRIWPVDVESTTEPPSPLGGPPSLFVERAKVRFRQAGGSVECGRIGQKAGYRLALAQLSVDHHRQRAGGLAETALEADTLAVIGPTDDPQGGDESRKEHCQRQQDQPNTQRQVASLKQGFQSREGYAMRPRPRTAQSRVRRRAPASTGSGEPGWAGAADGSTPEAGRKSRFPC